MKVHKFTGGGYPAFWAKGYVNFVNFRFLALFLRLYRFKRLLFLVMKQIHVNQSSQICLRPWMYTCITNTNLPAYRNRVDAIPKAIGQYSEMKSVVLRLGISDLFVLFGLQILFHELFYC